MDSIEAAKARTIPTILMSSLVETFRRKMLGIVICLGNITINTKRLKDSPILSDEFGKAVVRAYLPSSGSLGIEPLLIGYLET